MPLFAGALFRFSPCGHVDPSCTSSRGGREASGHPGITWCFKVDGKLTRTGRARHSSRGVQEVTVGDVEFADDTGLLGQVDELVGAEKVFVQTLRDWEQQEHQGKREKLWGDATTAC